jgi:Protein of unknown function (DUF1236)
MEDAMKTRLVISLVVVPLLVSVNAFAQSTTSTGAVNGAGGAAVGATVEIPNAVITSVEGVRDPTVVTIEEPVVVGQALPAAVEVRPVPGYTDYRYAVVNRHRVIVEPQTRRVIRVVE